MRKLWRSWSAFWFEAEGAVQYERFRRIFAAVLFLFLVSRSPDLELFYGESGWVPSSLHSEVMDTRFRASLLTALNHLPSFWAQVGLWTAHLMLLGALLALAAGWVRGRWGRGAAIVAFALHVSFLHRNMAVSYGADLIATFFLFYMTFADFSRPHGRDFTDLGSLAFRLSQIQLCVIYAYSGWEKLKGAHWWRGEAIWDVLANAQLARWDFGFVSGFPLALVAATYITLLWEIYFPALIWVRPLRAPVLVVGVLVHLGIGVSMNIPYFSALMVSVYVLFLPTELLRLDALRPWVRSRFPLKFPLR